MGKAQNSVDALNNRISAHANFAKYEINDWIIPILDVKKDNHVLDIACGNGKQLIPISKMIDQAGSITGLDISKELLNEVRLNTKNKNVILKQGKMEDIEINFENEYFDLIFCCFGLYYSTDYKKTIKDIYNKLKNNGKCFVCGPIKGNNLEFTLGFSHPVLFKSIEGVNFKVHSQDKFTVMSFSKELIGQVYQRIYKRYYRQLLIC